MLIVTIHHGILGDGFTKIAQVCSDDVDPHNVQSIREYVCEYHNMHHDDVDELLVIRNGNMAPFVEFHFSRESTGP